MLKRKHNKKQKYNFRVLSQFSKLFHLLRKTMFLPKPYSAISTLVSKFIAIYMYLYGCSQYYTLQPCR